MPCLLASLASPSLDWELRVRVRKTCIADAKRRIVYLSDVRVYLRRLRVSPSRRSATIPAVRNNGVPRIVVAVSSGLRLFFRNIVSWMVLADIFYGVPQLIITRLRILCWHGWDRSRLVSILSCAIQFIFDCILSKAVSKLQDRRQWLQNSASLVLGSSAVLRSRRGQDICWPSAGITRRLVPDLKCNVSREDNMSAKKSSTFRV